MLPSVQDTAAPTFACARVTARAGFDHFCLCVDVGDIEAVRARLAAAGIEAEQQFDGVVVERFGAQGTASSIYIRDPGVCCEQQGACALWHVLQPGHRHMAAAGMSAAHNDSRAVPAAAPDACAGCRPLRCGAADVRWPPGWPWRPAAAAAAASAAAGGSRHGASSDRGHERCGLRDLRTVDAGAGCGDAAALQLLTGCAGAMLCALVVHHRLFLYDEVALVACCKPAETRMQLPCGPPQLTPPRPTRRCAR
jgi:hypothetical protein